MQVSTERLGETPNKLCRSGEMGGYTETGHPGKSLTSVMECSSKVGKVSTGGTKYRLEPTRAVCRRNERERNRVKQVNLSFEKLRSHVPTGSKNKKLSKMDTLRSAVAYISYLKDLLGSSQDLHDLPRVPWSSEDFPSDFEDPQDLPEDLPSSFQNLDNHPHGDLSMESQDHPCLSGEHPASPEDCGGSVDSSWDGQLVGCLDPPMVDDRGSFVTSLMTSPLVAMQPLSLLGSEVDERLVATQPMMIARQPDTVVMGTVAERLGDVDSTNRRQVVTSRDVRVDTVTSPVWSPYTTWLQNNNNNNINNNNILCNNNINNYNNINHNNNNNTSWLSVVSETDLLTQYVVGGGVGAGGGAGEGKSDSEQVQECLRELTAWLLLQQ